MSKKGKIEVDLTKIPHYPAIASWYQAIYIYQDEETNKKHWLASPTEFDSLKDCIDWISNNESVLGHGKVDWEVMMIEKSIIDIPS